MIELNQAILQCIEVTNDRRCDGELRRIDDGSFRCQACARAYRRFNGIPVLRDTAPSELENDGLYKPRNRKLELEQGWYRENREYLAAKLKELGCTGPTLDIGCGNGLLADALPDYIGLEYAISALLDPAWGDLARFCGDGQRLPFKGGSTGVLVSVNAFEHVPQIDQLYSEIDRVMRPGGTMFLKPAWHCIRANTELIPIRPYSELNLRQKFVKAMMPVTKTRAYKFLSHVPWRMARRTLTGRQAPMAWTPLTPYPYPLGVYEPKEYVPDTDATASIDCHETILYFIRRGYECLSHQTTMKQILAGHDWVILQKTKA